MRVDQIDAAELDSLAMLPRSKSTVSSERDVISRLGRASEFDLPLGSHFERGRVRGYPIDFREKVGRPWPPRWLSDPDFHRFLGVAQWGLGAYERHLDGEDGPWLDGALQAGEYLVDAQTRSGVLVGGWAEPEASRHTYRVPAPWLSGMAQGEAASLLVRLYLESGRAEFAESARLALLPLSIPTDQGGVLARLNGYGFPEEYPTNPPSFILNGAIFAIWGLHDVWLGLGNEGAGRQFAESTEMLAENLTLWDVGYWSRYDLFPHPGLTNVASFNYHRLHINQLLAFHRLEPRPQFKAMAAKFERYTERRANRVRAYAHKVAFRCLVPRTRFRRWQVSAAPEGAKRTLWSER